MFVRLKPASDTHPRSTTNLTRAVDTAAGAAIMGDIGGETVLNTQEARNLRKKVWWSFAFDTLALLGHIVPSAVGGVIARSESTMERWFQFLHESGCRPLISAHPLAPSGQIEMGVEVVSQWPNLKKRDAEGLHDALRVVMRDPHAAQVVQEFPAPPHRWEGTPWWGTDVSFFGDSVFYVGSDSSGAHNLLPGAIRNKFTSFHLGSFHDLCGLGAWDIALALARATCVAADVQLSAVCQNGALAQFLEHDAEVELTERLAKVVVAERESGE